MSWVHVRLAQDEGGTRLTLEHLGWDLSFLGLALHLDSGGQAIDRSESDAWMVSDAGKAFMRTSANLWGEAHVKAGEDAEVAEAMARRTADFYTGS